MSEKKKNHIQRLKQQINMANLAISLHFTAFVISCCNFDFSQFPGYMFLSVTVSAFVLSIVISDELNDQMDRVTKGFWYEQANG